LLPASQPTIRTKRKKKKIITQKSAWTSPANGGPSLPHSYPRPRRTCAVALKKAIDDANNWIAESKSLAVEG